MNTAAGYRVSYKHLHSIYILICASHFNHRLLDGSRVATLQDCTRSNRFHRCHLERAWLCLQWRVNLYSRHKRSLADGARTFVFKAPTPHHTVASSVSGALCCGGYACPCTVLYVYLLIACGMCAVSVSILTMAINTFIKFSLLFQYQVSKGAGEKGVVWVARRVPDDGVCSHANQARIRTWPRNDPSNALYANDTVSFAVQKGLYPSDAGEWKCSGSRTHARTHARALFECLHYPRALGCSTC